MSTAADRERGDRGLTDTDQGVHAGHRPEHGSIADRIVATDGVLAGEGDRRHHRCRPRGDRSGDQHAAPVVSDHATDAAKHEVSADGADEGHVDHVGTERRETAIGEHQRLDAEHDGDAEGADPWPDQHRGEYAAEQVPARAVGDREVEHLDREDVGRDDAGQRDHPLGQLHPGGANARRETAHCHCTGSRRGAGVEESVRDVHLVIGPYLRAIRKNLLRIIRNSAAGGTVLTDLRCRNDRRMTESTRNLCNAGRHGTLRGRATTQCV